MTASRDEGGASEREGSPADDAVIAVRGVGKRFGRRDALRGLEFSVPRGSICGLIGPNGAGKTTTISLLLGLEAPSEGEVRVLGLDPVREGLELRQRIGYVPEKHHMYGSMSVARTLDFAGELYPRWDREERRRLVELLRLPEDRRVKELSRGELAKLALTIALAHRPELLILDEPTGGLDPLVRRDVLDAVIDLVTAEGRSVIFSSHIVSDLERIADRLVVIDGGRVAADAPIDVVRGRYLRAVLSFTAGAPEGPPAVPGAARVEASGRQWTAAIDAGRAEEVRAFAASAGASDCRLEPLPLEDVIVELMRRSREDGRC